MWWRKGALYKLHKAGITNNLWSVFSSFLRDRFYRNLVNSHLSDWACTTTGVPQGSLLSPFIFPDGLESEESILSIDLRLEELQWHEVVKLLIKEDVYIQSNMKGRNKANKMGNPFENLKLVSTIFIKFLFFHQMRLLQKLWKMLFISSKQLFSFWRYSNFCISVLPSISACRPLLWRLIKNKS